MTRDVLEIGRAIRVVAAPPAKRVQRLYELLYHQSNLMGDETAYVSMGYWPRESMTIDEASQALADLVADAGEFGPGDRILDVGFGYGDQDFRWLETCKPEKIVGVNVTPGQVRAARERARAESATRHLEFREGVATALPFPDEQSPAFRSRAGIVYRTVLRRGLRDGDKLKSELAKIDYVVAVARKKA
ncbi:SAM-dependent methyltransferase [Streptomyces malaysiensis]|uniref:SAM-dependent methyltransferase n=1 Tax=Streptomyces malaysiensis TaxID=92644 RepID=UPI002B302A14|nr:methyltransferase domain-containing protein [Streptomyces malaysiensis]